MSVGTPTPPAPPPSAPPSTPSPGPGSGSRRGPVLTVHGVVAPLAAALAVIAAATALSGVVQGWAWFGDVLVATLLIAATGIGTRAVRLHPFLVGAAQLLVLLMVVTGSFTTTGVLGVLPGPEAFGELHRVLLSGFEDIRTGLPPVEASHGIRCLIMITLGLVALVVDVLAVTAAAPAATGLMLLCVYAVPSALTAEMLPWWTFTLGVVAFAGLLAVDGSHRHRVWRNRTPVRGAGVSAGSVSAPLAVVTAAVVAGLVAGATITVVGTEGSLPGSGSDERDAPGGLGVSPFTSLRGMLGDRSAARMFEVDGLGDNAALMRAFTLSRYVPGEGWELPEDRRMPAGQPADGPLPRAPGDTVSGDARTVRVTPINWLDVWLPTYGRVRSIDPPSEGWYYDPGSGSVYSEDRRRPRAYTMTTSLDEPTTAQLRAEGTVTGAAPQYLEADDVDPRVHGLAERLTRNQDTTFDKARAVWRYFTDPSNGFVYDTRTAPASDPDALADFVLNGKRGFCEQYASAMAVMLRSIDVPSRVAVGFTRGYQNGEGSRVITSQDAHAWVEVYFDDLGWVTFDPTPLSNGRGYTPDYLDTPDDPLPDDPSETESEPDSATPSSETPAPAPDAEQDAQAQQDPRSGPPAQWPGWLAGGFLAATTAAVLVIGRRFVTRPAASVRGATAAAVAATWGVSLVLAAWLVHWAVPVVVFVAVAALLGPAAVREWVRHRRLAEVAHGTPESADAAWREVLAECADRGLDLPPTDTLRQAAGTIDDRFGLDDEGRAHLWEIVHAVERSWYSPAGAGTTAASGAVPSSPGDSAVDSGAVDSGAASPVSGPAGLGRAVAGLRASLDRQVPVPWRGRILPRSLLRRG